jgi:hypothetical protein
MISKAKRNKAKQRETKLRAWQIFILIKNETAYYRTLKD